ncbi:MAG: hypothetical protein ABIK65_00915 [Candidatus Eisenbacteria bacterium]
MKGILKLALLGAIALPIALFHTEATVRAEDREGERLKKQISIMEKIIDEAMVESEHALVKSTHPTRGVYIEGYGPVFTLEVGLVDERFRWDKLSKLLEFGDGYSVIKEENEEDGETTITIRRKKGNDEVVVDEEVISEDQRWDLVKKELVEVIRDYGDTIARAKPDEWLTLLATPLSGTWGKAESDRLIIRVQMKEITAFNDSKLSESNFEKRVQIIES